mgnify:CR=1 FL=1
MVDLQVHACTDVTGFGLAGHALEMAKGSGKTLCISLGSLPIMKGALDYASMGFIPAGAYRNREFAGGECEVFMEESQWGKAVRISGWKRPGVKLWKMKQAEVKPS